MNPEDVLEASLLDLLFELRETDLRLILGGGYGLYQKRRVAVKAMSEGARLLIPSIPPARSTNDLDVFLHTEIIADAASSQQLREALDRLGYAVIDTARYYQFVRKFSLAGIAREVKIDFLTRWVDAAEYPTLKVDERRIRPRQSVELHAHTTREAIAIEEEPVEIVLSGLRTTGEAYAASLFLPQTYPFLLMKLFAFRDQKDKEWKRFGREHALDLYTLVSIMTEAEFERAQALAAQYKATEPAQEAREIVATLFHDTSALGALRLREHQLFSAAMDVSRFLAVLQSLFSA